MPPVTAHSQLSARLQQVLPPARAEPLSLPGVPGIELYLLNDDFPRDRLDPEQMLAVMNYPAYWAFCWASGQVLARAILDNPDWVRGRSVVDFGAGAGPVGLAAAMAGARRVVLCDQDPIALRAARLNAEDAGLEVELAPSLEAILANDADALDVITVADVFYDRDNLPVLETLLAHFDTVLVSDSRLGGRPLPGMDVIGYRDSHTVPDLAESEEFNRVTLYRSH